jgi:hypothetical protein
MANNRITYATAQLAIKDNALPSGSDVMGMVSGVTASGALASTGSTIDLSADISASWPATGTIIIEGSGTNPREYATYTGITAAQLTGVGRAAYGTTGAVHISGAKIEVAGWEIPMGVQSVSIGTSFDLEDVFTLGQLDAYENVEGIPEIEMSVEKVLDGTKPLWLMTTDSDYTTLKGRTSDYKIDAAVSVFPDANDSATGTADATVTCSGMYVTSYGLSMSTDGNFTETVSLVGNDKTWLTTEGTPAAVFDAAAAYSATVVGSGVLRSEEFNKAGSTLPTEVSVDDHIQSIDISVDISREDIFELGTKRAYYKAVSFPVTVSTSFEIVTSEGDKIEAVSTGDNLTARQITLLTTDGLTINLGANNKVASVDFSGFDAGSGNGTVSLEYTNSNSITVTHSGFTTSADTNSLLES